MGRSGRMGTGVMLISFSEALEGRKISPLGRLRAVGAWRGAAATADKESAIKALMLEAEEFGADGVIDVQFETDALASADIDGAHLLRLTATGLAVRFAA